MTMGEQDLLLQKHIKTFLSLGGLFFFGPYIAYFLKHTSFDISEHDRRFILSYSQVGYLSIFLGLIVIVSAGFSFFAGGLATVINTVSVYLLVGVLLIGSVFIFADSQLLTTLNKQKDFVQEINGDQKNIVKSFIPGYNFYLWYHIHEFSHPYRYLKESLLWTTLFIVIQVAFHSEILSLLIILLLTVRIITLLAGYDLIPLKRKEKTNASYLVNIEELRADLLGAMEYLWHHYIRKDIQNTLPEYLTKHRSTYMKLYGFTHNPTLILQYCLLLVLFTWYVWYSALWNLFGLGLGLETLAMILFVARYAVMLRYKQFPLVPILHEISDSIVNFIKTRRSH